MRIVLLLAAILSCAFVRCANVERQRSVTYEDDIALVEEFNQWLQTRDTFVNGTSLAIQRREALLRIASEDPKSSILMSEDMYIIYEASISEFDVLPDSIMEQFETPFAGLGTLKFGCFIPESSDVSDYSIEVGSNYASQLEVKSVTDGFSAMFIANDGSSYKAHLFGSMAELIRHGGEIRAQGIVFQAERVVALWENSVRQRRRILDSTSSGELIEATVATDTGAVNRVYANVHELEQALDEGRREVIKSVINRRRRFIVSVGVQRKYLVIPIDFSDLPGYPVDFRDPTWTHFDTVALFEDKIAPFFAKNSYNQLDIKFDYLEEPIRMPKTSAFYEQGQNYQFIFGDAERLSGYDYKEYDTYVVLNTKIGARVGGIGLVGSSGVIINGEFDIRVICHEIGHNYGSWHADEWVPLDVTNPAGDGYMLPYGDPYAAMGLADTTGNRHFSARSKEEFGWIPQVNTREIGISGVYTLYAHDQVVDTPEVDQILTLRVPLSNSRHTYKNLSYDIELRGLDVWGDSQGHGVSIRMVIPPGTEDGLTMVVCNDPTITSTVTFCSTKNRETNGLVLDMTPTTPSANNRGRVFTGDGLLTASQSFSDVESMIHVRISEPRGTTPAESVRVELIYGTNDCWGQGVFEDGWCNCYPGYYSVDCKFETDSDIIIKLEVELSGDEDAWYGIFSDALAQLGFMNTTYSFTNRVNSAEGSTLLLKLEDLDAKQELRQATAAGALELEALSINSLSEGDSTVFWPQANAAGNNTGDGKIFGLEPVLAYALLATGAIIVGLLFFCLIGSLCKKKRKREKKQKLPTVVGDNAQNPNTKEYIKATAAGGSVYPHLAPSSNRSGDANANSGPYPPQVPPEPAPAAQNMSEASLYQIGWSPSPSRGSPASQRGSPMMFNSSVLPPHMSQQALYTPSPLSSAPESPQQQQRPPNALRQQNYNPALNMASISSPSATKTNQTRHAMPNRPPRDSPSMSNRTPRDHPSMSHRPPRESPSISNRPPGDSPNMSYRPPGDSPIMSSSQPSGSPGMFNRPPRESNRQSRDSPGMSKRSPRDSPSMSIRPSRDSPRGIDLPPRSPKPQGSPKPRDKPPQSASSPAPLRSARSPYAQLD
ncbi:hypothetical protein SARC_07595 [Sphaeroforma arctica JP610]|uniref:Peptidase M12B domain-containing protein n=1 Tax=Sphaeroforma arctica JP610 TaxID=667725 RepID=A0A0L0FTL1_9EUKA|nr:hypothetical protein SARC_07595 [Sphaeroforma arctica JP610]KNC80029.1 hypothetical protein SARC_07595 [Sphaeroforma arctica JP610]|eukprot:XP_014153931.1 hypothetical protein SARC_07595 [Sphaeroforma arctica JP610]